jgi:hypothetical protein
VINACVNDRSGSLRVVADADDCRRRETPLSFNTEGPPGPPGPAGPPGPPGPAEVVTVWDGTELFDAAPGEQVVATATCPEDMVVLGGGGQANDPSSTDPVPVELDTSRPDPYWSENPTSWRVSAHRKEDAGTGRIWVVAVAICGG